MAKSASVKMMAVAMMMLLHSKIIRTTLPRRYIFLVAHTRPSARPSAHVLALPPTVVTMGDDSLICRIGTHAISATTTTAAMSPRDLNDFLR